MLVGDASWKGAITDTPLGKGLLRTRLLERGCYAGGIQTLGEFGYEGRGREAEPPGQRVTGREPCNEKTGASAKTRLINQG